MIGQGADIVNGGADSDTLVIVGGAGDETLTVVSVGAVLTTVAGGAVTGIESVTANLDGGIDALSYAGNAAANGVTVNLGTATATGFTSAVGFENVTGGAGADTLTGDANANVLIGGGGADTLNGGAGIDVLNGGAGGDILTGGDGADAINTGATNDDIIDVIRFSDATEYGDTITNFDASGGATQEDRVDFGGALNTLFDDGTEDDSFTFVTGAAGGGTTAATVGQANGNAEALLLTNGVATADLSSAALVSAAFNTEFVIGGTANGEDALLVVDASDGTNFSVWQWVQAGGGETSAAELTLIGTFTSNAQVAANNFDFF